MCVLKIMYEKWKDPFLVLNKSLGKGSEEMIDFAFMYLYCIVIVNIASIVIISIIIWNTSNKENF